MIPHMSPSMVQLGTSYEKLGKLGEARIQFRRAYELEPSNENIVYSLANILKKQGN